MSNLRIDSFGSPKNSPPPAPPAPPAPDNSSDLAELAQWRAAFPNQTPQQVANAMRNLDEIQARIVPATKPKPAPKKKKAKK